MSDDKLDQAVFTIFRLTHEDRLEWVRKPPPPLWPGAGDAAFPLYFETHLNNRKLALYQMRTRPDAANRSDGGAANAEASEWSRSSHLGLLGENDELVFEFPASSMIRDLLDAVHYKNAKLDQFVDDLLKLERASEK